MGLEGVREKKLLYHLTKVRNMETIIRYGMLPRRYLLERGMLMESVGKTDEYARNVKMAECLTEKCIPADLFQCVYVPDMETKQYIEKLFQDTGISEHPPYVNMQPKWDSYWAIYGRVCERKYV